MDNTIRGAAPPIITRTVATQTNFSSAAATQTVSSVEADPEPINQDAIRIEALTQAAFQYQADPFVVSDRTFTIYKDATGQYIVRYRSLRDGKITYIPEPNILPYQIQLAQRQPLIEIKA
jgi:hypothetical protein